MPPLKVLIIRFSSIGDIVLTTPVIRCLRQQLNAEVHFLTKSSYATVLANNPYLSRIHTIKKRVEEVRRDLQAEQFTHVVDLHRNIRSWQVKRALSASASNFDKLNVQKWLLVNLKINHLPKVHIVDRYLATVADLGVQNDQQGLDFIINSSAYDELLPHDLPSSYLAFAIGAAHATKRLPTDKIIEFIKNAPETTVLLGGPDEAAAGAKIAEATGAKNLCGKVSIHGSAAAIARARLLITHDTGMMHIGAALGQKIVSIWGSTVPDFGMTPYLPQHADHSIIVENAALSCRPCSKIGYKKCPKGHFNCMREISSEQMNHSISTLLGKK